MRRARLAAAQTVPHPGDKPRNLSRIAALTAQAAEQGADLICFPEMATTGSTHGKADLAEEVPGPTTYFLGDLARRHHLWLVAGMLEAHPDGEHRYNAAVVFDPQGDLQHIYHKVFLFTGERATCTPGAGPCLIDFPFGRGGLTICYDYIFPGYVSGLVDAGAEFILHPTAWLTTPAWESFGYTDELFRAVGITRAVENTVWFVSANHSGPYDAEGVYTAIGRSAVIAPWGAIAAEVPSGEGLAVADVDFEAMAAWREQVAPYLVDRRNITPWNE